MKTLLLCGFSLFALSAFAQQSDTLYSYTNIGGKEVKLVKPANVYKIYKLNDSNWVKTTANQNLVMLKRETFSNKDLTILNGAYVEYDNGKPKLKGLYKNGKRVGLWFVYNEFGKVVETLKYSDD